MFALGHAELQLMDGQLQLCQSVTVRPERTVGYSSVETGYFWQNAGCFEVSG